jgi:hypothetical protein
MQTSSIKFNQMILDSLAAGERRELSMIAAIRNVLNRSGTIKGDLTSLTKSGLRKLLASGTVVERDGMYTLSPLSSQRPLNRS